MCCRLAATTLWSCGQVARQASEVTPPLVVDGMELPTFQEFETTPHTSSGYSSARRPQTREPKPSRERMRGRSPSGPSPGEQTARIFSKAHGQGPRVVS